MKKQPVVELDRDWLTLKEAAAYMRASPGFVDQCIKNRLIEGVQLSGKNGKWRVKSASIQKFMESGGRP